MNKIYFLDLGIRNALINNFAPLDLRNEVGFMWENFLYIERSKYLSYTLDHAEQYFWRKYSGTEVDYIESKDGKLNGYEFKWTKRNSKSKKSFLNDYSNASYKMIDKHNFLDFVL